MPTRRELRFHVFLDPDPRKAKLLDPGPDPGAGKNKTLDPDPEKNKTFDRILSLLI